MIDSEPKNKNQKPKSQTQESPATEASNDSDSIEVEIPLHPVLFREEVRSPEEITGVPSASIVGAIRWGPELVSLLDFTGEEISEIERLMPRPQDRIWFFKAVARITKRTKVAILMEIMENPQFPREAAEGIRKNNYKEILRSGPLFEEREDDDVGSDEDSESKYV